MEYTVDSNGIRLEKLEVGQLFTFRDSSNKLNIPTNHLCITSTLESEDGTGYHIIVNLNTGISYDKIEVYQDWVYQYKQQSPVMLKVV